jgi:hypothetical protein
MKNCTLNWRYQGDALIELGLGTDPEIRPDKRRIMSHPFGRHCVGDFWRQTDNPCACFLRLS